MEVTSSGCYRIIVGVRNVYGIHCCIVSLFKGTHGDYAKVQWIIQGYIKEGYCLATGLLPQGH